MKNQPLSNKTHSSSSEGGRDPERNWARCRQRESEKDGEGEAESSCYGTMVLARAVIYRSMSDNSIFITVEFCRRPSSCTNRKPAQEIG